MPRDERYQESPFFKFFGTADGVLVIFPLIFSLQLILDPGSGAFFDVCFFLVDGFAQFLFFFCEWSFISPNEIGSVDFVPVSLREERGVRPWHGCTD